jgi:hypothetical protein
MPDKQNIAMNKNELLVTKASGESVKFSKEKLRGSMKRAGANPEQIDAIIDEIADRLYEGITTKKIYQMAFRLLKGNSRHIAAKYHLKRAIMELGPSGYPFEKFIGEILRYQGYQVKVGQVVHGHCVTHEIDVIAEKGNQHFMIECKYHNLPGTICNVKIPLYIQARFKDVESAWLKDPGYGKKFHQGWVVTNTRFTGDALQYGNCAGLKLIGWNYPNGNSLRNQIDTLGLYPITCITSLTQIEKQKLLEKKIVLCKEICADNSLLQSIGVKPSRMNLVMEEVTQLCSHIKMEDKNAE